MNKLFTLVVILLVSHSINAQFVKDRFINAQIGYGISAPFDSEDDIADGGFFLQGEYVMTVASWIELRPYAGLILTSSDGKDLNDNPTDERATSKAFLIGGKGRLRAPIRWIAPYVEIGLGASVGSFETFTAFTNIEKKGLIFHIPFSLGLELGRNNNVDLGFTYYVHPSVDQFSGAFAVGISIPLKKNQ